MIKIVAGLALAMGVAAVPQPARRRLQGGLVNHGATGCTPTRKCSLCHGDCDRDADCMTGLQCYQRNGMQAIPGCTPGGRSDVRGYDFCYAAGSTNANLVRHNLVNLGGSGCSASKKCGLCEGDCDNDKQCMTGLQCFQRNDKRPVPGCRMNAHNNIRAYDFCITPTQGATNGLLRHNLVNKGWSGCSSSKKCGVCQGDCDNDGQCMPGLQCFQRSALQPVPGCRTVGKANVKSADFCITPTQGATNHLVRHNLVNKGISGCSSSRKCAQCQGDCDRDSDCMQGLKCFQRNDKRPVPGCRMNAKNNKAAYDFCITETQGLNAGLTHHNLVNKGVSGCSSTKRCNLCQGDCDNDGQCMPGLECFQRNDLRPVPGCQMNRKNNVRAYDFCITPTQGNTNGLKRHNLANKGWSGCSSSKPCGLCQGDCDSDKDCVKPLRCFQRANLNPVPGCTGRGVKSYDYCYLGH